MGIGWFGRKKQKEEIDYNNLPVHIAIIMDGNGRWAKRRGLPHNAGHKAGANSLREILRCCGRIGVQYVTVYAFSTENWKRSDDEVNALMELLLYYLRNTEKELAGDEARIRIIGDRSRFSPQIQAEMERVERVTQNHKRLMVNIALNYGGRNEMINAVRSIAQKVADGKMSPSDIDEETISAHLYTSHMPDPDLVIRTSAEMRLSNFMLWQIAYSEFYFTDTLWPDFGEKDLFLAISEFQKRHRRFGGR